MAIDIYQTQTMIAAMQLMPKRPTFLRDRYFETSDADMFVTEDVLVEYKDEKSRKMAPFVMPRKEGSRYRGTGTGQNVLHRRTLHPNGL